MPLRLSRCSGSARLSGTLLCPLDRFDRQGVERTEEWFVGVRAGRKRG